jgi:hypothetical protein
MQTPGQWSDRRVARYVMAWGVVLLAEATIMPALFGPRADVPLGWWGLGIALLVIGFVFFWIAPRESPDDE